jgi:hypothetical protein
MPTCLEILIKHIFEDDKLIDFIITNYLESSFFFM